MSEDGCAKAAIDCVEETPGNAKMVLRAQNYCQVNASKEQLQESNKMKGKLLYPTVSKISCP